MSAPLPNSLKATLRLQRMALTWEAIWTALQGPLMVTLLAFSLLWSGLLSALPRPLPLIVLVLLALVFLWSLRKLWQLRPSDDFTALRKLDAGNDLQHREASSSGDELAAESASADIWHEHLTRKLAALQNLKIATPKSAWRMFDPRALRLPFLMVAAAAFMLGQGDMISNFRNATSLSAPIPPKPITFDAWLKPPAYTGKAPVLLTSPAMIDKLRTDPEILTPENGILNLRVDGTMQAKIEFLSPGSLDTKIEFANAKIEKTESGLSADIRLERPVTIRITDGDRVLAKYPISLINDEPPKIEFAADPKAGEMGKLEVKWHVTDDYGVKSVTSEISLADEQEHGTGFEGSGVFLYDAPAFKVALKKPNTKDETETTTADLTGHPWAGLFVEMVLTATDGAGHKTSTAPKRFKLPERDFIKPLASALQEQRKKFILEPDAAADASTMIGAMLLYPIDIADSGGLIVNLAAINHRLAAVSAPDDVVAVTKDLWPMILAVESGKLDDAKDELKALAQQLKQALRDGAPQDKIDELTRRMREAMNKLMSQLQKDGKKRANKGEKLQSDRLISPKELQSMLDDIERMSKDGDKSAAEKMLSQLDELLQNLKPGEGQQADNGAPGGLQDQMDSLSQMMGKQRRLMDETQRLGQQGDKGDGEGLGNKQKSLKDQLGKLGDGLQGDQGGQSLRDAGKNMGNAEGSLRGEDKREALRQQNEALRKMMDGMGKLAQEMKRQGQGDQNGDGRRSSNNDDPLGRPRATHDPNVGPNKNLVPSELAMKRAREILEQLRNKVGEQGLDEETKAYIDRLLKEQF